MAKGGRIKGKKNLKDVGYGSVENQHGVRFTKSERKKLESLVNSANRKRKRMLQNEHELTRFFGGKDTGQTIGETTGLMGKESDFILAKKTKSLNRFRNKKEYNKYIKNLSKVVKKDYVEKKVRQYKDNHIKAIKNVFGPEGKEIIKQIKKMDLNTYMKYSQSDEALEIDYIYGPEGQAGKLKVISAAVKNATKTSESK